MTFYTGYKEASQTAQAIDPIGARGNQKLLVRASTENDGSLYVGSAGVTPLTGFQLTPGEQIELPPDTAAFYIVSDSENLHYSYLLL